MFRQQDRYDVAMVVSLAAVVLTTFVAIAHALHHLQILH